MMDRPDHVQYYERIKSMFRGYGEIKTNLPTNEILKLYANCFAVLFTSINEDFGLVPLEAFASSKPCIAMNEGGPREIVKRGVGYLVNDSDEMAERMKYLTEHLDEAEGMGKAGRKYVEKNFSWKNFMKRFEKVCLELSKNRP